MLLYRGRGSLALVRVGDMYIKHGSLLDRLQGSKYNPTISAVRTVAAGATNVFTFIIITLYPLCSNPSYKRLISN
jgi:hypothetical protein